MALYKWSQTAAANASADSSINWTEGQAPSSVNDSARAMMAVLAKYRDDISGAILTSGDSTHYTLASNSGFDSLAHMDGQIIAFTPHATNAGQTVALNVDNLGSAPLRTAPGVGLVDGTIIQGTPYVAVYNNSDGAFHLQGFYGNPYNVPLAAGLDYWAPTAPNSSFAFPVGQAISRSAYAALFSMIGTTYGVGDGSTTFNLPDKRGRVSVAADSSGTILTSFSMTPNGNTLGAKGGVQSSTLVTSNLPPYTPSGVVPNSFSLSGISASGLGNLSGSGANFAMFAGFNNGGASIPIGGSITTSFVGTVQGGTSTPFSNVQPAVICNYIMRII